MSDSLMFESLGEVRDFASKDIYKKDYTDLTELEKASVDSKIMPFQQPNDVRKVSRAERRREERKKQKQLKRKSK